MKVYKASNGDDHECRYDICISLNIDLRCLYLCNVNMTKAGSIKLKAAFLLTAFGLNTVVGFACSVGLDMGFNAKHHHDEDVTEAVVHIHNDGKKHIHYEKKDHENDQQSQKQKDDCCNDIVLKLEQLDKSVPQSLNIIHPIFLIGFFDIFYNASLPTTDIVKNIKQFVRSYHPPISDIRIAIRSFQI
jgi:hypothetical protein